MKASIDYLDGRLFVKFIPVPALLEIVKNLDPRRRFDDTLKGWWFPAEPLVIQRLCNLFGMDVRATVYRWANVQLQDGDPEKMLAFCEAMIGPQFTKREPPKLELIANYDFLTTPYEHQRDGLAELVEHDKWLLAWQMGCGKTKPICDRLRYGFSAGHITGATLIFCPKSVVPVWPAELKKHAGLKAWTLLGTKGERLSQMEGIIRHNPTPIFVTNYEAIGVIGSALIKLAPQVVICDETHVQKRSTTKTSRGVRQVAASAKYRWALSGTPAPNSPLDIFGTMLFLDPTVVGTQSKTAFEATYGIRGYLSDKRDANGQRIDNRQALIGYQNLDDLSRRVASISSYIRKEDVLKDLPPKVFMDRFCELEGEQKRVYVRLREDAVAVLRTKQKEGTLTVPNILTEQLRLLQVVGGFVPDNDGNMHAIEPNAKIALLKEVLEDMSSSVIIWFAFREELFAVAEMLAAEGESLVTFYGDTSDADRAIATERFQKRQSRLFLGTAGAGGMGLTLTAAENMIYYSRNFKLTDFLQSVDRAHRIGQLKTLNVTHLRAAGTVDDKVHAALENKAEMQDALLRDVDVEDLL